MSYKDLGKDSETFEVNTVDLFDSKITIIQYVCEEMWTDSTTFKTAQVR